MTPEALFLVCNNVALLCWILLVLLPRYEISSRLIIPVVACSLLACLYLYLLITSLGDVEGGFTSLDGIASLFQKRQALLAGWIHYLVFDLFIGCWEVRDAKRNGIPHLLIVPALLLTFLLGPIGLLTYFLIRYIKLRRLDIGEV